MNGDFTELLQKAKAGDRDAQRQFYERYERLVLEVVRRRLGPGLRRRCDTVDVAQSVFEDVLRDLPRFEDRGEEAFRHWLTLKAENKVHDAWRRQLHPEGGQREGQLVTADGEITTERGPGPATRAELGDDCARLRAALATLSGPQREVLKLRDQDELAFADIAERLGLSNADAARMRYARALVALRRAWGEQ